MSTKNTKSNVSVGKPKVQGAIFRAPAGTTLPTDAASALSEAFIALGYVSSDGLKNTNSKNAEQIRAWGGDIVAVVQSEHTDTFEWTNIESLNSEVLKMAHGDSNVSGTLATGISISVNGAEDTEHVYVCDMELYRGVKKRVVIPCGVITAVGDVAYKDKEVIGYPVTVTALPDDDGYTHYEYIAQPASS